MPARGGERALCGTVCELLDALPGDLAPAEQPVEQSRVFDGKGFARHTLVDPAVPRHARRLHDRLDQHRGDDPAVGERPRLGVEPRRGVEAAKHLADPEAGLVAGRRDTRQRPRATFSLLFGSDEDVAADLVRETARRLCERVRMEAALGVVRLRFPSHALVTRIRIEERLHVRQVDAGPRHVEEVNHD